IFIDASSIEIFINKGKYVFTELVFPENPYNKALISLSSDQETKQVTVNKIKGIW
ncbi:MAG: glycoside hydrolase family 32 protein, partial [Leptolyngbya sp. SIO3F4]|nr:glycoside hydrolase family 32 protein [Leptolyngbya sp. SIO3F4]